MRILFLTVQYLPEVGGIASLLPVLARRMKCLGHEVVVATPKSHIMQSGFEIIKNVRIYRFLEFPHSLIKKIIAWPLWFFILFRLAYIIKKEKIDVVNIHFVYREAIYALILKKIMNFPLVVSVHGYDVQVRPYESSFYNRWTRRVLKDADFVTACSESLLRDAQRLEPSIKEKSAAIYNCVDVEEFVMAAEFKHNRRYILSVGNFVHKKGFDILVKAFARIAEQVKDADLIMAGDGQEKARCEKLVAKLNLNDRIIFFGKTDKEKTAALFKGCEFFVLPSRQEPFGIVNLEAMAAGKAILATRVDGVPEVVKDGVNGVLVNAQDEVALSEGILKLWRDEPLRQRLGQAGRKILEENFTASACASKYIACYKKTLGEYAELIGERIVEKKHDEWKSPEEYIVYLKHIAAYEHAKTFLKGKRVLEIGCGSGYGANLLSGETASTVGVDISKEAISEAALKYEKENLEFLHIGDGKLPFSDGEFDAVASFQVIEHVEDVFKFLSEAKRVLKKDGLFLISTPNARHRLFIFQKPWNPHHKREYRYRDLLETLKGCFHSVDLYGLFADRDIFEMEIKRTRRAAVHNLLKRCMGETVAGIMTREISFKTESPSEDKDFVQKYFSKQFYFKKTDIKNTLDFFAMCKLEVG